MGLINISHAKMTQSAVDLQLDLMKNPFYLFNDKKGLPVEYYNINTNQTTLDNGLKIEYDIQGKDSSLRFDLIHNFYIYGISSVSASLENSEFGIVGGEVSGEAIILPDTIQPYPGDNFVIPMIKAKNYRFTVTAVDLDTFDNGANYWKISYQMTYSSDDELKPLVVNEYNFITGNVGTQFSPVVLQSKYDVCKILDDLSISLKDLYKGLYFNNKVQTYTFVHLYRVAQSSMNSDFFYDPYLIEFCIKHNILNNENEQYDFIDHKTHLFPDFKIKYARSLWKVIEIQDKTELSACKHSSAALYIDDPATIFHSRYEDYFELTYNDPDPVAEMFSPAIDIIDPQVIGHILENQLFDDKGKYGKYNILVKYFNYAETLEVADLVPLEHLMESDNSRENYFFIPIAIYVIEFYIKKLMKKG